MQGRRSYLSEKDFSGRSKRLLIATVAVVLIIVFFGPSLFARLSLLLTNTKSSDTDAKQNEGYLFPPTLDPTYEATNSAELMLSGSGTAGKKVIIYKNDDKEDETVVGADGHFEVGPITLSKGSNIFSAQIDSDGKTSDKSETISVLYKTEPPKIELSSPNDGDTYTGEQKQAKIEGTTEKENTLYLNDHIIPVSSQGTFFTSMKLADGDNKVLLKAVDPAGNEETIELTLHYRP